MFKQTVAIPLGANCPPLLADLFLYSWEAKFIQKIIEEGKKGFEEHFISTFVYIDDVLSVNNPKFVKYLHRIYQSELEIRDTTDN